MNRELIALTIYILGFEQVAGRLMFARIFTLCFSELCEDADKHMLRIGLASRLKLLRRWCTIVPCRFMSMSMPAWSIEYRDKGFQDTPESIITHDQLSTASPPWALFNTVPFKSFPSSWEQSKITPRVLESYDTTYNHVVTYQQCVLSTHDLYNVQYGRKEVCWKSCRCGLTLAIHYWKHSRRPFIEPIPTRNPR